MSYKFQNGRNRRSQYAMENSFLCSNFFLNIVIFSSLCYPCRDLTTDSMRRLNTCVASPSFALGERERGLTRPERLHSRGVVFESQTVKLVSMPTAPSPTRAASHRGGFNPPVGAFSCSRDFRPQLSDDRRRRTRPGGNIDGHRGRNENPARSAPQSQ